MWRFGITFSFESKRLKNGLGIPEGIEEREASGVPIREENAGMSRKAKSDCAWIEAGWHPQSQHHQRRIEGEWPLSACRSCWHWAPSNKFNSLSLTDVVPLEIFQPKWKHHSSGIDKESPIQEFFFKKKILGTRIY